MVIATGSFTLACEGFAEPGERKFKPDKLVAAIGALVVSASHCGSHATP